MTFSNVTIRIQGHWKNWYISTTQSYIHTEDETWNTIYVSGIPQNCAIERYRDESWNAPFLSGIRENGAIAQYRNDEQEAIEFKNSENESKAEQANLTLHDVGGKIMSKPNSKKTTDDES